MMKKMKEQLETIIKMPPYCVGCTKESNGLNKFALLVVKRKRRYGTNKYNRFQKKAEVHFNLCAKCEAKSKKKQLRKILWFAIICTLSLIISIILGRMNFNIFLIIFLGLIEVIIVCNSARAILIRMKFLRNPEIEYFRAFSPEISFLMAKYKKTPIQIQLKFRIPKVLFFFKAKISPIRSNITCDQLKRADRH
ncbi:MAG: hypothetical protein ACTSYI_10710 [Promethearchaeota archaeon]